MKMKRNAALFLAVLMLFSAVFSTGAAAASSSGGFKYRRIASTNNAAIMSVEEGSDIEKAQELTIPAVINGLRVTAIDAGAFANNTVWKKINLPDSVDTIGSSAFYGLSSLTEIKIPKKVVDVGSSAFANCTSLKSVDFSASTLTQLPMNMFSGCTSLNDVILPSGLNTIDEYAFNGCSSLKRIYIPASTSNINKTAFTKNADITFYGVGGSTVKYFAYQNGYKFVPLEERQDRSSLNTILVSSDYKLKEDLSAYVQATVTSLKQEYSSAKQVYNDFFQRQADIDAAAASLTAAFKSLKLQGIIKLQQTVDNAQKYLDSSDLYTENTISTLQKAVNNANDLIEQNSWNQSAVASSDAAVSSAVAMLVLRSREDLQGLYNECIALMDKDGSLYTTGSVTRMNEALENTKKVLDAAASTDQDCKKQLSSLIFARNKMELISHNALKNSVAQYSTFLNSNGYKYTEASVNSLYKDIEQAKTLLADAAASDAQLKEAKQSLADAYNALQRVMAGDTNLDGKLSVVDAVFSSRQILGLAEFNKRQVYAADFNGDGKVTLIDVVLTQRAILND